jgi:radical SAM protein with 4Fe4S-binding SPASM domain
MVRLFKTYIGYYRFNPRLISPQRIYVEITGSCNLKCPNCPRTYSTQKRGDMDNELFRAAIQNISQDFPGLSEIGFHGFGEITLKKDFAELICWAREKLPNTNFAVSTNLSVRKKSLVDDLLKSCLDSIGIWPDGFSQNSYEKIRTGGSYLVLMDNLKFLLQRRKEAGKENIAVHVGMVKNRLNEKFIDQFINEFQFVSSYRNTSLTIVESHDWAGQVPSENVLISARNTKTKIPRPCFMPFTTMLVAANGVVSLCCSDMDLKLRIGHIAKGQTLKEIWTSVEAEEIRKSMLRGGRPTLCRNCEKSYWTGRQLINKIGSMLLKNTGLEQIQQVRKKEINNRKQD